MHTDQHNCMYSCQLGSVHLSSLCRMRPKVWKHVHGMTRHVRMRANTQYLGCVLYMHHPQDTFGIIFNSSAVDHAHTDPSDCHHCLCCLWYVVLCFFCFVCLSRKMISTMVGSCFQTVWGSLYWEYAIKALESRY